jgi:GABA permease
VLISMGQRSDTRSQLLLSLLALAVVLAAYLVTQRTGRMVPALATPVPAAATVPAMPSPLQPVEPAAVSRVLVLANETVQADALLAELRRLHDEHAARYLVCVPAHPLHSGQGAIWAPGTAVATAQHRLDATLEILRGEGLDADGVIGDYRPLHALDQAVREFRPDLIVISTHPEERSAWLRQDIIEQARRKYSVPVRHVVSTAPVEIFGVAVS